MAILMMAVAIGGAAAGAFVNGWRLEAIHLAEMSKKDSRISELEAAIGKQNSATELLEAASKAADERRLMAESMAADAMRRLGNRADVVANSRATSCDGVLKEAWGTR